MPSTSLMMHLQAKFMYHAKTMWLFVASDIKTMVVPTFIFATMATRDPRCQMLLLRDQVFSLKSMRILVWVFAQLLVFTIANQNRECAVVEDAINKPWRPLVARRITPQMARVVWRAAAVSGLWISRVLGGGAIESLLLIISGSLYNDFGLGDTHWLTRNVLNGAGMMMFAAGATSAALQTSISLELVQKLIGIAIIIATTIHAQDVPDQLGDRAAGRQTVPLRFGDGFARWSLCSAVTFWTIVVFQAYFDESPLQTAAAGLLGATVSVRTVLNTMTAQDKRTFWFYNAWLMTLYSLICGKCRV